MIRFPIPSATLCLRGAAIKISQQIYAICWDIFLLLEWQQFLQARLVHFGAGCIDSEYMILSRNEDVDVAFSAVIIQSDIIDRVGMIGRNTEFENTYFPLFVHGNAAVKEGINAKQIHKQNSRKQQNLNRNTFPRQREDAPGNERKGRESQRGA